ncbi:Fe2+-dependent dioxygenase [Alishewanella sp. SMS8]|uniref:Fe2+-dependent dioxygenase n=1 Tax=Alishewanella sp. SMS8 TaxID=2994676 RepID=UPI002741A2E3|nr:Fe2+-dependent dioxygenase [Alishewanella sp. SMS8]MDP5207038.1 Fe2+-dependent dioxygenase [Alishewanella sp. SMS9]MDP5458087.1 Fe2+-dependent dioxygenase [Alishewanella sp. SMS8]
MHVLKQLLTKTEVAEFRQALQHVPWLDGKGSAMGMAVAVKHNAQADRDHHQVQQLANRLLAKFGHNPSLMAAALPHRIYPPCFNSYAAGGHYGWHVDAAIMRLPDQQILRSDLSITVFLSEPEDYQGGELVIQTDFGEQSVKLAAGDAVLYSSATLHQVMPVTAGQRVAAISWLQSMIPGTALRETLYQLDLSIQALAGHQGVERAELDRLHHIYHNLIRQHAQV